MLFSETVVPQRFPKKHFCHIEPFSARNLGFLAEFLYFKNFFAVLIFGVSALTTYLTTDRKISGQRIHPVVCAPLCGRNGVDTVRTLSCGPYTVDLFTVADSQTVVYAVMDREEAQAVWPLLKEPKPALAAVSGVDWNRELSPWPAPGVFRGGGDFGGEGPAFLDILIRQIIPLAEAQLGFAPVSRAVAGYSLAGLFALWSVFQTDVFDRAVSASGSLWFDGFMDYMSASAPPSGLRQVYLSLGDKEKNARNQRMAAVEDCTCRAAELLREWNIPVMFEMNPGGHFQDIPGRIARGIDQLMESTH